VVVDELQIRVDDMIEVTTGGKREKGGSKE
jgi:hypothetical protein